MAQTAEHGDLLRALGPRSGIVAPMSSGGGVFGALILVSKTPGRYGARDASFMTELARRAAVAIDNAHLYEAAQRATQARDEVLAVVAHDVRNPLAAIGFATSALAHAHAGDGSDKEGRSVAVIRRSVERANRLIQDLLDTTRLEAGALSVELKELSATEVLGDAAEAGRPLATSASLELRLDATSDLPRIRADRARLLQVFENLVGNAIRYTPGGGRITLGAASRPGEALFWVSDTGAGIAAEDLPHVFDRFWKAKSAERHGAGLGLAICKGIVEAHAGRLWVESVQGQGSTFFFTVPAAAALEAPRPASRPPPNG
jgi:signal transduction histidine kinase